LIEGYENKMMPKQAVKYIGDFDVWIPDLKKIVKPGEIVEGFPIAEAEARSDFIVIKIKGD
jgi:hypothetical protein